MADMDFLSDILNTINLTSSVYFEKRFYGNWGMSMDKSPFGQFHCVTRGSCTLKINSKDEIILLSTGDVVMFPFGHAHLIADSAECNIVNGKNVYEAHLAKQDIFTQGDEKTTLICGHFEFEKNFPHPLIKSLPDMILIRSDNHASNIMIDIVKEISLENSQKSPGYQSVIHKLAEILFIKVLRHYAIVSNQKIEFLKVFNDKGISEVLNKLHNKPDHDWNLDLLAKISGNSRTSFINKFKKITGLTPIQYLTNWRLLKARNMIKSTDIPLSNVGREVGYNSEVSFSRAFKRQFNTTPGRIRKST